jgi:hypothetical protein
LLRKYKSYIGYVKLTTFGEKWRKWEKSVKIGIITLTSGVDEIAKRCGKQSYLCEQCGQKCLGKSDQNVLKII